MDLNILVLRDFTKAKHMFSSCDSLKYWCWWMGFLTNVSVTYMVTCTTFLFCKWQGLTISCRNSTCYEKRCFQEGDCQKVWPLPLISSISDLRLELWLGRWERRNLCFNSCLCHCETRVWKWSFLERLGVEVREPKSDHFNVLDFCWLYQDRIIFFFFTKA